MGAVRWYDRSRLYKRDHSPLRPNFDPPIGENSGNVTDAKNINVDRRNKRTSAVYDISSRLSCWFRADVKEPYPRYVRLFSGTRNFLIFTMCQNEIYVSVRWFFSSNLYWITHGLLKITIYYEQMYLQNYHELQNKISYSIYRINVNI